LIQAVERSVERSIGTFAKMEKQVELRIGGLQRAGITALEGLRLRHSMSFPGRRRLPHEKRNGRQKSDKQRCEAAREA
jgi:hypothetical protein